MIDPTIIRPEIPLDDFFNVFARLGNECVGLRIRQAGCCLTQKRAQFISRDRLTRGRGLKNMAPVLRPVDCAAQAHFLATFLMDTLTGPGPVTFSTVTSQMCSVSEYFIS